MDHAAGEGLERIRELKGRCSREVICDITSVPAGSLDPHKLLQLPRGHWAIENSLFHVRDVTFREDACRVRTRAASSGHPRRRAHLYPANRSEAPPSP